MNQSVKMINDVLLGYLVSWTWLWCCFTPPRSLLPALQLQLWIGRWPEVIIKKIVIIVCVSLYVCFRKKKINKIKDLVCILSNWLSVYVHFLQIVFAYKFVFRLRWWVYVLHPGDSDTLLTELVCLFCPEAAALWQVERTIHTRARAHTPFVRVLEARAERYIHL